MDSIDCVNKKIDGIIEKSLVPEDPVHAKNTLEWLLKLEPDADEPLKKAHALNSAKILTHLSEKFSNL